MAIVLLVLFVVCMLLWILNELGAVTVPRSGLLAWLSVLLLFLLVHGVRT